MKIDYANRMGLAGLMVWAVDLDDSHLTALKAISNPSNVGAVTRPFDLVDLENLFPEDLLPPEDTPNQYGLVNFGLNAEAGQTDPANTGFGFMLVTGESFAVSQLRKRDGLPDPFVFLDCPEYVNDRPLDEPQVARVACMSEDVAGCFRILERGVEGTLVEMPDNVSLWLACSPTCEMGDNHERL
jgi:chitinase